MCVLLPWEELNVSYVVCRRMERWQRDYDFIDEGLRGAIDGCIYSVKRNGIIVVRIVQSRIGVKVSH